MNRRILVIEDDANVSDMLQRWLQELDFSVVAASDGPEGLELFENYRPELVLLDIAMPLMNGFEVARMKRRSRTASWLHLSLGATSPSRWPVLHNSFLTIHRGRSDQGRVDEH